MIPQRPLFWNVENSWLFYLLAALALACFTWGLVRRVRVWRRGVSRRPLGRSLGPALAAAAGALSGRRLFRGDVAAGLMHLLILWGFTGLTLGTLLAAIDHYVVAFLRGGIYLVFSVALEIAGLMLLAGLVWALIRRYLQRVPRLESRLGDLGLLTWLLAAALTGFAVEGLRLAAQQPEWGGWSFAGLWTAGAWPDPEQALAVYPVVWWLHAVLSLALVAAIPFSKLLHALAAPVSGYLADRPPEVIRAESRRPDEGLLTVHDRIYLDACTRCGRCVEVCPPTLAGEPFSPRALLMGARDLVTGPDGGGWDPRAAWHCTTCGACLEVCPVHIATWRPVHELRRAEVEDGTRVAPHLTQTLERLFKYQNPWEASKKKRAKWGEGLGVADLSKRKAADPADAPLTYFVGCTTALDTRAQALARSFVAVLDHAGVAFGTLGKKEPCCGDIARRLGEDGLFEEGMEGTLARFERHGLGAVVTSSPHCLHTMKREYPAYQALAPEGERTPAPSVRHYTEVLDDLVRAGALAFERELDLKVTYHDPCYLARHNGISAAPRRVLRALPGVELIELERHGSQSLCCGGGGGRMWQEELDAEVKVSELRVREAAASGADVLVTACPLCLVMLDDANKTAGLEETLEVRDLNELVVEALAGEREP